MVDVGLVHLAQELPGVGGEALHVAALSLRVDGVECREDLPLPESLGHHHHHVPRHGDRYVLEIVFARPPHDDLVFRDLFSPPSSGRLRQVYGPLLGGQRSSLLLAIF